MASAQALPEPMNSSPHHPKVKLTTTLADPTFVAGEHVSGKLEMECRADRGLGIGIMMVELFAIQELTSRDHSATSTFIHSRRLFQGPGLPPSNAVQAHPMPGDPPLPQHYYQARRGRSTFLFRIPIPASSPSSITFSSGLAKVRYELRASVGVFWKNEKRLVVDKHSVDIVEAYPDDAYLGHVPEAVVVGESGKLWMQGRLTSGVVVAGGTACLELQVKNHSSKKNNGLTLAVTRTLYLPAGTQRQAPVLISDTLTTVPFRGPEYIVPPGAEGVANLVFDVPKYARGVRGGTLDGEESEGGPRHSESLFEIRCKVEVKFSLGMGSKDLLLEMPIDIVHPKALPPPQDLPGPYGQPYPVAEPVYDYNPYYHPPPTSPAPIQMPYVDPIQNQVWLPPPPIPIPGYPYYQPAPQPYYAAHDPTLFVPVNGAPHISRPLSAGPVTSASQMPPPVVPGLPDPYAPAPLLPLHDITHPPEPLVQSHEAEEGKGERALRVTQHLRMSSRTRSVSPQSHRYPLPLPPQTMLENTAAAPISIPAQAQGRRLPAPPPPPLLLRQDNLSTSPPGGSDGVVHSPRPQLTPKHSFTRDPVLGATVKSERVEELEKMADVVARKSQDLSNDVPKGIMATLEAAAAEENAIEEANVNKTLPGPPVPSGKQKDLLGLPSRARADLHLQHPPSLPSHHDGTSC
ncbi:hypothetical protein NLJ89_g3769 [Agrocybe chaxingu]|uniref:Arrestin C-terminal-like domain-containing protein n=1 Tax=Agrocybe chaxingu TaxID=84603 RepID=A0A9W8K1V3_9AGAR|nr:hypothetical protein NLJ89_g3769 [Agrocybe chaxingu]